MSGAAFLRLKKLTGGGIMLRAARHNRREIQAELGATGPIEPSRSSLNITLIGPPNADEVAQLAKAKIAAAGISKVRKDAVVGVEFVFSLPTGHQHDVIDYFTACAKWVGREFGGVDNIVSADIHRDESQDHAHILLVPILEGRLRGSEAVGNKRKLSELQSKFFRDVAAGYGFSKPRGRLSGKNKTQAVRQVLDKLRKDPAAKSEAWAAIRDNVERDPLPYALTLGIGLTAQQEKPPRTMAQIFTSKGRGERREKPIGFDGEKPIRVSGAVRARTLGLCRLSPASAPSQAPAAPEHQHPESAARADHGDVEHCAQVIDQTVTIREDDFTPDQYDPETGEFYESTPARKPDGRRDHR